MDEIINTVICNDIIKLINELSKLSKQKEKFGHDFFLRRYLPNIVYRKKHTYKRKKYKKRKFIVLEKHKQCTARFWCDSNNARYDPIKQKWYYGKRCSRKKKIGNYCMMHYKQSKTSRGLPHGNYFEDPPHPHFYKYKNKIELKYKIKYINKTP